jgi:hypothetical protein
MRAISVSVLLLLCGCPLPTQVACVDDNDCPEAEHCLGTCQPDDIVAGEG